MGSQAMHIVNGPVSAMFAIFAAVALAFCVLRARQDLDERLRSGRVAEPDPRHRAGLLAQPPVGLVDGR
jgi:hypothetical protein